MSAATPERLHAAFRLILAERNEEALQELLWFREHADQSDPIIGGLRQSYALIYWIRLADQYPPARAALDEARERALTRALEGERAHLLDVISIDHAQDQPLRTRDLLLQLEALHPALVASCARAALPLVMQAGDAALAERLMPDPAQSIRQHGEYLMWAFQHHRRKYAATARIPAEIDNYVGDVNAILDVLCERGRHAEAQTLRTLAADIIPATTVRRAVRTALARVNRA